MDSQGSRREWLALIGDVIDSRRLPDRARAQEEIGQILEQVNQDAAASLASPLGLIRGDEIQALFRPEAGAFAWIRRLRHRLRGLETPVRLRLGLGLGEVTTSLGERHPWELDGPAFHRARRALEGVRTARGEAMRLHSGREELDEGVNALLGLMSALVARWTPEQWQAVDAYEVEGTYERAASRIGIAFQNVQKRCAAAHWREVRAAEEYLDRLLARLSAVGEG